MKRSFPDRLAVDLGDVGHILGVLLSGVAAALLACGLVGVVLGDGSFMPLALSAAITAAVGLALRLTTPVPRDLNYREAFVTVTFAWLGAGLAGMLPYLLSGTIPAPAAAFFESMSGFTTTGATALDSIETVAPGILLWRSLTQWLGGMGIIVLGIAVLPYLGVGGMQLFRLEAPGPTAERLRPRIRETAKLLWSLYLGLSVILFLLYWLGGMTWFDAVNHSLTTMPTGGFSTRDASIGAFGPFVQWVCVAFMYLCGISFALHYRVLGRGVKHYLRSAEWRLYTGIILGGVALMTWMIGDPGTGFEQRIRDAAFQVVAIVTTTGYGTADYMLWAPAAQLLLFLLFFLGGMAGSTAGGMKMVRVLLVLKHSALEIKKQLHPRAIFLPKVGGAVVSEPIMLNVLGFILIYMILFGVGTLVMAAFGMSPQGAAGAAASAISNVGPGLAEVGPAEHYGFLPGAAQVILALLMMVGRLEIYTVLLLFHPRLWRR